MSIKKKLGMGIATLSLGAVMALGGTFAAFNDVEKIQNSLAAGTLNLDVSGLDQDGYAFKVSNLKPGDTMTRTFSLRNAGSLAIQGVYLSVDADKFLNGVNEFVGEHGMTDNTENDFLSQFQVTVLKTDPAYDNIDIVTSGMNLTLLDLVNGDLTPVPAAYKSADGKRLNLSPAEGGMGSPHNDGIPATGTDFSDDIVITLQFINDPAKVTDTNSAAFDEYLQNVYQGDSMDVTFTLEATQWEGINGKTNNYHENENKQSHPQDE